MPDDEPLLGLATTRELLTELHARGEVSGDSEGRALASFAQVMLEDLSAGTLDYRTVDS
jgi:hypothetical protein